LAYPTVSNISVQQKSYHTQQEYQPIKRNTQWQGVMKARFTIPSFGFEQTATRLLLQQSWATGT